MLEKLTHTLTVSYYSPSLNSGFILIFLMSILDKYLETSYFIIELQGKGIC